MKRRFLLLAMFCCNIFIGLLFAQTTTVPGKVITGNERWNGLIIVEGDVTVAAGAKLEILPGTRVLFSAKEDKTNSGRDKTRSELIVKGTLIARGEINNKIWFTSSSQSPRMQDWFGIQIMNPKQTCVIEYAVVEYAYNGITIKKCDPLISNLQLQYNYNAGLTVEIGARPKIIGNIISENGYAGVICNTGAKPILTDNMITKNEIGLISFGTAQPNLGNLTPGKNYNEGRNGLFENLAYNIHNHSVRDIFAENSSWGSRDVEVIAQNIYDREDDSKYGQVDIQPVLGGAINLEQKVLLSQSTEEQRTPPLAATQPQQEESVVPEVDDTQAGQTAQTNDVAIQPQISEIERLSVKRDSIALVTNNVEQDGSTPEETPEPVPTIDYNQVFLDAFLDEGRMILKTVRPVIHDRQRGLKMKGKIIVKVIVDRLGNVEEATVLRGLNAYYDDLALEAAKKFKFKPGTLKGNPVRFSSSIFFEF